MDTQTDAGNDNTWSQNWQRVKILMNKKLKEILPEIYLILMKFIWYWWNLFDIDEI